MQAQAGAENGYPGVAQAYDDSTPILLIPAGAPLNRIGVHPTFNTPKSYATITKWADQISMPTRISEVFRRAFSSLRTGRPGPVLLELPTDVAQAEVTESDVTYRPVLPHRSSGDPSDISQAVTALLEARLPVLHAGQGVLYAEAWDELLELAELLNAPVMTTLGAKGVFPEDHPLALGSGGSTTTAAVVHFLKKADVVFGIGCSFTRTEFGVAIPPGKILIHNTNCSDDLNKDYLANYAILGDTKLVLQQIIQELQDRRSTRTDNGEIASAIKAVKLNWLQSWTPKLHSQEVPINPYRVVWDLMQTLDRHESIVIPDSGSSRDELSPFFETLEPRGFIGWGKSTQLGSSLGFAMGAKLAAADKVVVNVMGDTAFGMVGLDFETAVREKIPIITIVLNNSGMGIYGPDQFPIAQERYNIKEVTGRYAEVVSAMGGHSRRVENPDEIGAAIREAINLVKAGEPAFIEVITCKEHAFSDRLR